MAINLQRLQVQYDELTTANKENFQKYETSEVNVRLLQGKVDRFTKTIAENDAELERINAEYKIFKDDSKTKIQPFTQQVSHLNLK